LSDYSNKKLNPKGYNLLRSFEKNSVRISEMNKRLNPTRMNFETRAKLSVMKMNTGNGKSYTKSFGVHMHRKVAERMLGRKLLVGEVVHHIDGDKKNNNPSNLMIFRSQADHARWHKMHTEEVMPHDI